MEQFLALLPYIVGAVGAAIGLAAAVAKFTKSKRDDEIIAKIDEAFDKAVAFVAPDNTEDK